MANENEQVPAITDIGTIGEETVFVESPEHIAQRSSADEYLPDGEHALLNETERESAERTIEARTALKTAIDGITFDPEFLKSLPDGELVDTVREAFLNHPSNSLKGLFRDNPEELQTLRNKTGQLYNNQPSVAFHDQAIYAVQQEHFARDENPPANSDLFVVWFVKVLGNWKALVGQKSSTNYYEVTFNGAKQEAYVDRYGKISNSVIPAELIEINYPENPL